MGCLFEIIGKDRFKFINSKGDEIKNIFLPLSNKQLLIGTSLAGIQDIDIKLLNEEIAKHSREFFVSSKKSIELITLSTLIGSEIEIISREEMEQIVNELFSEYSAQ